MFRYRRTTAAERAATKARNLELKAERAGKCATCQICARAILANTGLIAHHGYQRPSHGWQTASCMGARFRPYEVACDALPPAIEAVKDHIARTEHALANWQANPPEGIRCERQTRDRRTGEKYTVQWTVIRPVGFDRSAPLPADKNQAAWDYTPARRSEYSFRPCDLVNYAHVYAGRLAGLAQDIAASKHTLAYFEKRLAEWVAPKESPDA